MKTQTQNQLLFDTQKKTTLTNTPTFINAGPMTGPHWSATGVPSDHVIFDFSVDVSLKENIRSKRYDFKHANFESLKQTLLIPLSNGIDNLNSQQEFDSLWDSWNDSVQKVKCEQTNRARRVAKGESRSRFTHKF